MNLKKSIIKWMRSRCEACQKRELERQKERLAELEAEENRLESRLFTTRLEATIEAQKACGYQKLPDTWERWVNGETKH